MIDNIFMFMTNRKYRKKNKKTLISIPENIWSLIVKYLKNQDILNLINISNNFNFLYKFIFELNKPQKFNSILLDRLINLQKINLSYVNFDVEKLNELTNSIIEFKMVNISSSKIIQCDKILDILSKKDNLKNICLAGNYICYDQLKLNKNINDLDLEHVYITYFDSLNNLFNLTRLNISYTQISDNDISNLLINNKNIKYLNVQYTNITLEKISEFKMNKLEYLDIYHIKHLNHENKQFDICCLNKIKKIISNNVNLKNLAFGCHICCFDHIYFGNIRRLMESHNIKYLFKS